MGQFGLVFEPSFCVCFTPLDTYTSRKEKRTVLMGVWGCLVAVQTGYRLYF
jgi:hypothetical protein